MAYVPALTQLFIRDVRWLPGAAFAATDAAPIPGSDPAV